MKQKQELTGTGIRYNAPTVAIWDSSSMATLKGSTWVSVNQNLTPGEWYHIAGTFDGTTLRCYLNGVETDTNLLSAIKSGNATLFIGQVGWGNIFNGVVDELKIYNRALSAEEIKADYEAVSPVGEWHFEEGSGVTVEDTSVNNNNGALVNMDVTAWVAGKPGTALQFDGVDDYVDCGNDANLDITDAITIETWLKPNVAGEGGPNAGPVCKAEAEVDWSWQLRYNAPGGYMGFQFNGDPEDSTWVSVNQNLTPGEWYHLASTFDGTTVRCYLNGEETDTNLLSAIKSSNATLFIGQDGWGHIFNGVVDEVKIYNRALTVDEIQADYEAGLVYMKGDFNINGDQADAGDLVMMEDAKEAGTSDVTYDLNGDGNLADEDDLRLLKDVSVGEAVLE